MTAARFNELVRLAAANTQLPGTRRRGRGGVRHDWTVTVSPDTQDRQWRVTIGPGTVNDRMAAITYLRVGDPRGWIMPEDYAPWTRVQKIYGPKYPFVDRPLTESDDPPHLLITAPSADGSELGGFVKVADKSRPPAFRSAADWERDLYLAHVWVSVATWRADPAIDHVRGRQGITQPQRWRVLAGALPNHTQGVRAGDAKELARLWLLRDPAHPADDELRVQQRTFHSFATRAVEPFFGLAEAFTQAAELTTLAILPLGAGGLAFGTALLAGEALLVDLLVNELSSLLESAGSTEFWSV